MRHFGQNFGSSASGLVLPNGGAPKARGSYEGADGGPRFRSWSPADVGPNTAIETSLYGLRSRQRQLIRDNPVARSAISQYVTNVVGTGMQPQLLLPDPDVQKELMELWRASCNEMDADERVPFSGMQATAMNEVFNGEVLLRRRPRRTEDGLQVPIQVQLIPGQFLDHHFNQKAANGNAIKHAIEVNAIGKRVAYHLWRAHPGEYSSLLTRNGTRLDRAIIPASEIAHAYDQREAGQMRGVPHLHTALLLLAGLHKYQDAELERKVQVANKVGFIISQMKDLSPADIFPQDPDAQNRWVELRDSYYEGFKSKPGTWGILNPGDDVHFVDPADVGGQYEVHMRELKREVAAAGGISYEQLTGDMRNVNMSSARVRLIDIRRGFEMTQMNLLGYQVCRPVWQWWLSGLIASGRMALPKFKEWRHLYMNPFWVADAFESIDPLKELMADVGEVRAGFASRRSKQEKRGRHSEVVHAEIRSDNEAADRDGMVFSSDARKTSESGIHQAAMIAEVTNQDTTQDSSQ